MSYLFDLVEDLLSLRLEQLQVPFDLVHEVIDVHIQLLIELRLSLHILIVVYLDPHLLRTLTLIEGLYWMVEVLRYHWRHEGRT
jgi:hypothetical protein